MPVGFSFVGVDGDQTHVLSAVERMRGIGITA
jgi:hypothetical protein